MTNTLASFSNFFETTLDGAVGASDTQLDLSAAPTNDGSAAIAAPFYLVINPDSTTKREVIRVTASSGTNMQTVTRDVEGRHSPDPTHDDGTVVRMAVVAEMFEDLHDRINDVALTGDVTGTLTNATSAVATTIAAGAVDYAMIADTVDEDDMTSNSATKLPSQQSVKAYVDSGATTMTNKTLQDYAETKQVLTSSSNAVAIDLANGNVGTITLTEDISVFNFTNVPATFSTFQLYITQHASSNKTVAISCTVNGGGAANALTSGAGGYTVTTGANKVDIITFAFVGAATPHLSMLQDMRNS